MILVFVDAMVFYRIDLPNNSSIDNKCKESVLVGSSVVHQQSSGIVITDGCVGWALSSHKASCRSNC
jgi:hypothetical protein